VGNAPVDAWKRGAQVWMHFLLNSNFFCVIGFEHVGKTGSQRFAWIRAMDLGFEHAFSRIRLEYLFSQM
jgi:hypothetical protein